MIATLELVELRRGGGVLTAAVTAGATTLPLDLTLDYNESGGLLELNGVTYTYTAVGDDFVTLATGILADAEVDTPAWTVDAQGNREETWIAWVDLGDDGDTVPASIPTSLIGYFPEGDAAAGQDVEVEATADGYRVVSRPDQVALLSGSALDPDSTIPVTALTDGLPPTTATTVTPIGGIGSMFYRWTEVANADPVTYRLYVRAGASPAAPTLLATNLSTNPSFETGATGWAVVVGSTAPAASTDHAWVGTQSLKTQRGAGTAGTIASRTITTLLTAGAGAYSYAIRVWIPGSVGTTGNTGIRISGAGTTLQDKDTNLRDQWVTISGTFTWDGVGAVVMSALDSAITAGIIMYYDGFHLVAGSTPPTDADYFDGDTPDTSTLVYAWTGTAHASTSTKTSISLDPIHEVAAGVGLTSASVRKMADGTAIVADGSVIYHALVTVEDADGPGPVSSTVTGVPAQITSPDIAANAITANLLVANDAIFAAATGGTFTGVNFQTSATPDQGIHIDSAGLRAYGSAGGAPFLDVNPAKGLVIVAGEGTFDKLTTSGALAAGETSAELGGLTQIKSGGKVTLVGGALPPAKSPTVDYTYDVAQFTNDGLWPDRHGWSTDGTYWYTARFNASAGRIAIEKWDAAGTLVATDTSIGGPPATVVAGIVHHSGNLYLLWADDPVTTGPGDTSWRVYKHSASTLAYVGPLGIWPDYDGSKTPAIGVDAGTGDLLIAQSRPTNGDKVRIKRYTMPATTGDPLVAGTSVDTSFAYKNDLAGITYGTFDLGANRYVLTARSGENTYKVADSTGAAVAAEDWQSPARRVGFAYTGTAFVTMDYTGTMRTFTGLEKTTAIGNANLTKWVSSTNYRGGTPWETPQSPRASITIYKRSKLTVTTAGLPATPGTNDPNQVQVYVGQGSTNPARTSMWRQTTPAVGVITATYTSLATSGTNPPAANNFPAATQAILEATTNGFTVDAASNGSIGTGTFRDSVDARVTAVAGKTQAGTVNSGTLVAATAATVAVTFPTAFSAAPIVVPGQLGGTGAIIVDRRVTANNVTATGFDMIFWRATGTAAIDANWIAFKA